MARLAYAFVALAVCLPASGQVTVIGSGLARDCYLATETSLSAERESIETCTKALSHEVMTRSDRVSTLVNRGILHMRNKSFDDAAGDFQRAIRINDESGEAHLNLGALLIYQKDFAAAKASLDRAIELKSSKLFAAHYNRAIAFEKLGQTPQAYADFQRALELKPDFEQAAQQLTRFTVVEGAS